MVSWDNVIGRVARLIAGHPQSHVAIPVVAWTVTAFQKSIPDLETSQPRLRWPPWGLYARLHWPVMKLTNLI